MGFMDSLKDTAKGALGVVEKAVLIVGDTSQVSVKEVDAPKPSAGSGGLGNLGDLADIGDISSLAKIPAIPSFDPSVLAGALLNNVQKAGEETFEAVGNTTNYRFEVQFNPAEITISGYGGEKLPTQNFGSDVNNQPPDKKDKEKGKEKDKEEKKGQRLGSRMASADTRITMSFKVCFDKVDPQDAFYSDKFTLSGTSIATGAVKGVAKALGKKNNSVRPEVEALHAIARDPNKKLAMFVWGNMKYEGVINGVDSEYVMFNVQGEPIRAYVIIRMVLFGKMDLSKNVKTWNKEYTRAFYKKKTESLGLNVGIGRL